VIVELVALLALGTEHLGGLVLAPPCLPL